MTRNPWGQRARIASATLVVLSLVAAACGDDDDEPTAAPTAEEPTAEEPTAEEPTAEEPTAEEPTAEEPTAEEPTAEEPTAEEPTAEEPTAEEPTGDASGIDLAAAQAIVEEFSERPTEIPNSAPIQGEIPTDVTAYFISCGAPACEAEIPILEEATGILGWEFESISTDPTDPSQIPAAWDRVVNEQPDVVFYTATPIAAIQSQFDAAVANGTLPVACCVTDEPGDDTGLLYTISTPEQTGELGRIMAAWVVADAGGEPVHSVYLDLPEFPILSALRTDYIAALEELCEPCTNEVIEFGLADLATASDQVVSFLRANPEVTYVIQSTDSTFSLPAALDAAGLEGIRIFGEGPTSATLADIEAGRQAGTMAFAFWEIMFSMVDAAARELAGDPLEFPAPPNWILTAGNFPTGDDTFPLVEDVVDRYRELWGK